MKIFVATPVYDGKLPIHFVKSISQELAVAHGVGDTLTFDFLASSAGVADGRNILAQEFLESGCDRLVFLDSDITFEPGSLIKLAHKSADFVGGCYRYKKDGEEYPIRFLKEGGELWANQEGLIEVAGLPTGFLALSRSVFEKFDTKFPERARDKNFGGAGSVYFQMPFHNGCFYGEDYFFCKEWSEMGGKIYLDPEITLTHWSFKPIPHEGHIGNWLKNKHAQKVIEEVPAKSGQVYAHNVDENIKEIDWEQLSGAV